MLIWNTKLLASDMDGGKRLPYARKQHSTAVFRHNAMPDPYTKHGLGTGDQLSDGMFAWVFRPRMHV
jgi:hypothetical protein